MATKANTARKRSTSRAGTDPPKRSVAEHSAHPESPADSTVRHTSAPSAGYPQGEYDVVSPAKAAGRRQDPIQAALDANLGDQDQAAIKKALAHPKANRLSVAQRSLALEALPIGAVLEHEGHFRWRVKGPQGQGNRFGHGSTAQEAIDAYILGSSSVTITEAGVEAFRALPASQQKEIEDRDRKAARAVGQSETPEATARRESAENLRAAKGAKAAAPDALTDGPEIASAQLEAGARRSEKAARTRSSARRRTGGKARK